MRPLANQMKEECKLIHYAIIESYLGWLLIAATKRGICKIDIDDSLQILRQRLMNDFPEAMHMDRDHVFSEWVKKVQSFLDDPKQDFLVPLDVQGTDFQKRVWEALQTIQPGSTVSYSEIAIEIGKPKAVRAVARACASNTIAILIPCHRVRRSNGNLAGYRWGLERKRAILEREVMPKF